MEQVSDRKEKTEALVQTEWEAFQRVQNAGGRAACQDDHETFTAMRRSQFSAWTEEMIDSWQQDLEDARTDGRNLLAEKYAWMMQSTAPEEFERIRHLLPEEEEGRKEIIEKITAREVAWMLEYKKEYPCLAAGNRVIRSGEDTPYETSFETYLRGELHTYSMRTLGLYRDRIDELEDAGENLAFLTMGAMVREYGYRDLAHAEKLLAEKQARRPEQQTDNRE